MAIQAHFYPEYLGFTYGVPQDLLAAENVCGFNLTPNPPQNQNRFITFDQFQDFAYQKKHNFSLDNNSMSDPQSMAFYQSIVANDEKQSIEIDRLITLQNERLRLAMQEQIKQQTAVILKTYETKTQFILKEKEEEITKAANRRMELHHLVERMEMENQTWQRLAKEKEFMVASLNTEIERLRESASLSENAAAADDASSCCQNGEEETGNGEEESRRKMICKWCNIRKSCVIMWPCRHLCSCLDCEPFLHFCPVCGMLKKSSIEALI